MKLKKLLTEGVKFKGKLNPGGWSYFTTVLNGKLFNIEAKIFDEGSIFGIDEGRISKLFISGDNDTVLYERGWSKEPPKSGDLRTVYNEFIKIYN